MLVETDETGTAQRYFVNGAQYIDERVLMHDYDIGADAYYIEREQHTVAGLVTVYGQLIEKYAYDAYGKVRRFEHPFEPNLPEDRSAYNNPYYFTGRRLDEIADTAASSPKQLYHYRERAYEPVHGRFLQRDPIGYSEGMNLYAYVGCAPTNWVDPTGTILDTITGVATQAACKVKCCEPGHGSASISRKLEFSPLGLLGRIPLVGRLAGKIFGKVLADVKGEVKVEGGCKYKCCGNDLGGPEFSVSIDVKAFLEKKLGTDEVKLIIWDLLEIVNAGRLVDPIFNSPLCPSFNGEAKAAVSGGGSLDYDPCKDKWAGKGCVKASVSAQANATIPDFFDASGGLEGYCEACYHYPSGVVTTKCNACAKGKLSMNVRVFDLRVNRKISKCVH